MVEYYGWITLAETPADMDAGGLDAIVEEVRRALEPVSHSNNVVGIKVINGSPVVWLLGCPNHWSPDTDDALALYEFIAARAPGSYGLLYASDTDEPCSGFRVWRLARGKLEEFDDHLLSPRIPAIEDEWTEAD
jgi:hypothetical protein